jgi:uncharacterized GH25 family protein
MNEAREVTMRMALLLALAVTVPTAATAHDTWLRPERYHVRPGERVALELTSAMQFPEPETAVTRDRLAAMGMRVGEKPMALRAHRPGARSQRLSAPARTEGIATVWIETKPRDIDLTPDEVEEYLAEAGADDVRDLWRAKGRGPWRETYVKLAKSFVRVGDSGGDRSWSEPVGLALEIVPEDDPTALTPGQPLRLRVLEDGGPAIGLSVAAVAAGGGHPVTQTTGTDGRIALPLSRPGQWLVKATRIRPGTDAGTWRSRFATVTVSVGAR